jgi:hypothetical protein
MRIAKRKKGRMSISFEFIRVHSWFILKKQSQLYRSGFGVQSSASRSGKGNLKKQTQFCDGQHELKYLFERRLWRISCFNGAERTKPNKANLPAYSRKSEARSSTSPEPFPDDCCPALSRKADNSGCIAGRVLPRVGREMTAFNRTQFEKAKPIYS